MFGIELNILKEIYVCRKNASKQYFFSHTSRTFLKDEQMTIAAKEILIKTSTKMDKTSTKLKSVSYKVCQYN